MHHHETPDLQSVLLHSLQAENGEAMEAGARKRLAQTQSKTKMAAIITLLSSDKLPSAGALMEACDEQGFPVNEYLAVLESWFTSVFALGSENRTALLYPHSTLGPAAPEMVLRAMSSRHPRFAHCFSPALHLSIRPQQKALSFSRMMKKPVDFRSPVIDAYNMTGVFPSSKEIPMDDDLSVEEIQSAMVEKKMRDLSLEFANALREGSQFNTNLKFAVTQGIGLIQGNAHQLEKTDDMATVVRTQLIDNRTSKGQRVGKAGTFAHNGSGGRVIKQETKH